MLDTEVQSCTLACHSAWSLVLFVTTYNDHAGALKARAPSLGPERARASPSPGLGTRESTETSRCHN